MSIKMFKGAAVASVLAVAAMGVSAQAASTTGTAKAEILTPITVTADNDLDFGTVILAGATTVTVAQGDATAGTFDVTADASSTLNVTSDASVTLFLGGVVGAADTMSATLNPETTVATDASGAGSFAVGGTLTVAGTEADGAYSGTYNVTVEY